MSTIVFSLSLALAFSIGALFGCSATIAGVKRALDALIQEATR